MPSKVTIPTLEDAATLVRLSYDEFAIQFPLILWEDYKTSARLCSQLLSFIATQHPEYLSELHEQTGLDAKCSRKNS